MIIFIKKGTVKNSIGLVRHFLPKKTDFAIVDNLQLTRIKKLLNNRPRKCLNYKRSLEVFNSFVALAR